MLPVIVYLLGLLVRIAPVPIVAVAQQPEWGSSFYIDHSISLIIKQAQTIANPLHAIELKLLIETRLQDLAKLKELTLSERASDDTLEEIMRLETALHQALARCHLFMENREMYGKFVIHKHMLRFNETIVERWSRRITRLSYFAIPVLLGILAFRGLRTIGPHIRSLDL